MIAILASGDDAALTSDWAHRSGMRSDGLADAAGRIAALFYQSRQSANWAIEDLPMKQIWEIHPHLLCQNRFCVILILHGYGCIK